MSLLPTFGQLAQTAQKQGSYLARAARMMVGVPDYGQYLRHMQTNHPDTEPMSYEAFFRNRLQARYERGGAGCC